MTEAEAREIVEKYEALVLAAARDLTLALWPAEDVLKDHRLTVRDGRLEFQMIRSWTEYDSICHDYEATITQAGYYETVER